MIKRIKSIKQIGPFCDFKQGGHLQLQKINFIYGHNTYGKSTLCDIFMSLKENNAEIIKKRKTIPGDGSSPRVELSIEDGEIPKKEKTLEFKNNKWDTNSIGEKLEIFDTSFMHDNIFTGMTIERNNKENFTDFILGKRSVDLAKKLEDTKRKLAEKKRDIKNTIPLYVNGKTDSEILKFVNLKVKKSLDEISNELHEKKNLIKDLEYNRDNTEAILSIKNPSPVDTPNVDKIHNILFRINDVFSKCFDTLQETAATKLFDHVQNILSNSLEAENWIRQGLDFLNSSENSDNSLCPFCGQDLKKAKNLIESYQAYFREEYIAYTNEITETLDLLVKELDLEFTYSNSINNVIIILKDYIDKIKDKAFQEEIKNIQKLNEEIKSIEIELKGNFNILKESIIEKSKEKKRLPFKKMDEISIEETLNCLNLYKTHINKCNKFIKELNHYINSFKNKYANGSVTNEIKNIKEDISNLEYLKSRIEQDEQCKKYLNLSNEIKELEKLRNSLTKDLDTSQEKYLQKYFETINSLFKQFGSDRFTIKRSNDARGFKKVYGITVNFEGKTIKNDELPYIFSESDRRALALAVFLSKIYLKETNELKSTIIILDDPVTSFDDNRITKALMTIKENTDKVKQIIIFTHYQNLIKKYYEKYCSNNDKYLQIVKENKTNRLEELNIQDFTRNEYQRNFFRIYGFINNDHSNDITKDLRVFFEEYLHIVFMKNIAKNDLTNCCLRDLIDKLYEYGSFSESSKNKLHTYRETLNPEHHKSIENNIEDIRTFAKELIEFLYNITFKE